MGHCKRFDIFFDNHFGVGVRWYKYYPYTVSISIALIFFSITLGFGRNLQDLIPTDIKGSE